MFITPVTTYVTAVPLVDGKVPALTRMSRSQWYRAMLEQGRFVIEDKQFQAGRFVRSVPKINKSPADSSILQR